MLQVRIICSQISTFLLDLSAWFCSNLTSLNVESCFSSCYGRWIPFYRKIIHCFHELFYRYASRLCNTRQKTCAISPTPIVSYKKVMKCDVWTYGAHGRESFRLPMTIKNCQHASQYEYGAPLLRPSAAKEFRYKSIFNFFMYFETFVIKLRLILSE